MNVALVARKEPGGVASTSSPPALANRVVGSHAIVEDSGMKARLRQEWQREGKKEGFWHWWLTGGGGGAMRFLPVRSWWLGRASARAGCRLGARWMSEAGGRGEEDTT